jgi:hypothetical protein
MKAPPGFFEPIKPHDRQHCPARGCVETDDDPHAARPEKQMIKIIAIGVLALFCLVFLGIAGACAISKIGDSRLD